ncbi:cation diffusion facilitator family transporter [Microbacterium sp. STN6]|uniref:cation diffusion facilitator family transporter n=1 Tax=Microbacterium sp. STN6 TaxID=2995588 RepID=UPI00226096D4|nr:cation diffusion facilitator family transporter [Microbacterium sp. STN6]MCX7523043.1 cation diffusion facilitator family transporter [Microbacterium sp. STN6]
MGTSQKSSLFAVVVAFSANLLIAIAKSIAATLSGSASMVAEAAHSWADTGNEVFLLIAERRSARASDRRHPLGYGKEAYVWSMFAAMGLFTAGAVVSVMHGVTELTAPEADADYLLSYIVLAVSAVLEGTSFVQAYRQAHARASKRGLGTLEGVLGSSNPTLRAVFAEDAAALIGLVLAAAGILLHELTGYAVFDAIGSILIGVLLAIVALILIDRNRRFLVGQTTTPEIRSAIMGKLLEHDEVARVTYLHLEYVGPERLYLVAAVDMVGNEDEEHVAHALRRVERQIELDEHVAEAVLTLAHPDDPSLTTDGPADDTESDTVGRRD